MIDKIFYIIKIISYTIPNIISITILYYIFNNSKDVSISFLNESFLAAIFLLNAIQNNKKITQRAILFIIICYNLKRI